MHIANARAVKLFFGRTSFLQVYFEAIANAFDANADRIDIEITADTIVDRPHITIECSDDGDGFTNEHFARFARLVEPKDENHKGLGRLVYLKYFDEIAVDSSFGGSRRRFTFSERFEGESEELAAASLEEKRTVLRFRGFRGQRLHGVDDIKPGALKSKIIEQFFPFFHARKKAGRPFHIRLHFKPLTSLGQVDLIADEASISTDDVPEMESVEIIDSSIHAYESINLLYTVDLQPPARIQITAADVDGRTIPIDILKPSAIPFDCTAIFIFESSLFSGKSDSSRQRLVLPDDVSERRLKDVLRENVSRILNERIPEIAAANAETKKDLEDRFPHLIGLFSSDDVGLISRNDAIEHAQSKFFREQRDVVECDSLDERSFDRALDVSARSLTEYILYRDYVIRKLRDTHSADLESVIHELVVPRFETFQQENLVRQIYRNNVWLLDDKFMTFRTILSEARMDSIIAAITTHEEDVTDATRPDISMIFSGDPDDALPVDVVVVELKRRRVDDRDGPYAATQLAKRAQKLVEYCPNIQRVWYYGIIEIDNELGQMLRVTNWVPLFSRGHVYYQEFKAERADGTRVPAPTFLVSYDAVAHDAAARNHTFLELLRSAFREVASVEKKTPVGTRLLP